MPTTTLRKVGGSVMLAVPPAFLDLMNLSAGAQVAIAVADGKLIVEPVPETRYTLEALLAQCAPDAEPSDEERAWLRDGPHGSELL